MGSVVRQPTRACALLLVLYLVFSLGNDLRGTLGTDSGGKLATLVSMEAGKTLRPDVGYWAEQWDPSGKSHGLIYTARVGNQWVNVTSLPMMIAAYPLWVVGGGRAALLVPMIGAVVTALAAAALDRRLRGGDGMAAFWLVGLASPTLIYALDLWEHTLGLACMAWAVVLVFDVVWSDRSPIVLGLVAGALFGLGFSMRTESLVYGVFSTATLLLFALIDRRVARAAQCATGMVAGFAVAFVANRLLEQSLLGTAFRSSRAADTAAAAGTGLGTRAREGFITLVDAFPALDPWTAGLSLAFVAALVIAVWGATRADRSQLLVAGLVVAVVALLLRFATGLGFVPGLAPAWPFAAAGLAAGWHDRKSRALVLTAIVPLPVVFLFQFPGGALPQWAGRYILTSGLLLAVAGFSQRAVLGQTLTRALVGLSVAVSAFGLCWLWVRTHAYADLGDRLEARAEDVLIADNGFLSREFGATYGRKHWLAPSRVELREPTRAIAVASGASSIGLVYDHGVYADDAPPPIDGFSLVRTDVEPLLPGNEVLVASYRRNDT